MSTFIALSHCSSNLFLRLGNDCFCGVLHSIVRKQERVLFNLNDKQWDGLKSLLSLMD